MYDLKHSIKQQVFPLYSIILILVVLHCPLRPNYVFHLSVINLTHFLLAVGYLDGRQWRAAWSQRVGPPTLG